MCPWEPFTILVIKYARLTCEIRYMARKLFNCVIIKEETIETIQEMCERLRQAGQGMFKLRLVCNQKCVDQEATDSNSEISKKMRFSTHPIK